jgi:hypothetical protein
MSSPPTPLTLPTGHQLSVSADCSYEVLSAKGKPLAKVPAKVRKTPQWQRLLALREVSRRRADDVAVQAAAWRVAGTPLPASLLDGLWADPIWADALRGGLAEDGEGRAFLRGDPLALVDERGAVREAAGPLRLLHAADLDATARWAEAARRLGFALHESLLQSVACPREVERALRRSERFADRTLPSAVRASYALNAHGWVTRRGVATRTFPVERPPVARWLARFVYFEYGEAYGDWNQPCTTGALTFERDGEARQLQEVPAAVFSEACAGLDAALARASGGAR